MRCKKLKENMVLDLYGELNKKEKNELNKHLAGCMDCAKEHAHSRQVFQALEEVDQAEVPEPEWDFQWNKISSTFQEKREKGRSFSLAPRWAAAAAGILLIFILGILTGRFWAPHKQELALAEASSPEYLQETLQRHFDEIKPLLVNIANYTAEENGSGMILLDREVLQNLIIQNILLKSLISGQNPSAEQILEDVELVLRELANMEEGDARTKSMVKNLIDEREILLKMNIL